LLILKHKFLEIAKETIMDINIANSPTDNFSLFKKENDSTVLAKEMENQGEVTPEQQSGKAKSIVPTNDQKQGTIDLYA
jgi:hypothetical protein